MGVDLFLAFCPERIAEGKAREELHTLPQIVGSTDAESGRRAAALFGRLTAETLPTDWTTAELVKLFNNILRYVHFALANQFALVADDFGANIHEIRRLANHGYPRSFLAAPGMTAGTCLRKDFGMLNEWSPYPDMLLSAWKMNEYVPAFLVQHLPKRTDLHDQVVAVLGFTFKADTDDLRDSLAPKLFRYVNRQMPLEIRVTDHHLVDPIPEPSAGNPRNWDLDEALDGAGVVFVATNHTGYREALRARRPDLARHLGRRHLERRRHRPDLLPRGRDPHRRLARTETRREGPSHRGQRVPRVLAVPRPRRGRATTSSSSTTTAAAAPTGCSSSGRRSRLVEGDIRDPEDVRRATEGVEVVYHLAYINGTRFFYERPDDVLEVGIKGTLEHDRGRPGRRRAAVRARLHQRDLQRAGDGADRRRASR